MNKGTIRAISAYGFQVVEEKEIWHNFDRNRTQVFSEFCKKNKGKAVFWEENENGLVIRVGTPETEEETKKPEKPSLGLTIKGFNEVSTKDLTDKLNQFGKVKKIIATQTHIENGRYIAFVWY